MQKTTNSTVTDVYKKTRQKQLREIDREIQRMMVVQIILDRKKFELYRSRFELSQKYMHRSIDIII